MSLDSMRDDNEKMGRDEDYPTTPPSAGLEGVENLILRLQTEKCAGCGKAGLDRSPGSEIDGKLYHAECGYQHEIAALQAQLAELEQQKQDLIDLYVKGFSLGDWQKLTQQLAAKDALHDQMLAQLCGCTHDGNTISEACQMHQEWKDKEMQAARTEIARIVK